MEAYSIPPRSHPRPGPGLYSRQVQGVTPRQIIRSEPSSQLRVPSAPAWLMILVGGLGAAIMGALLGGALHI